MNEAASRAPAPAPRVRRVKLQHLLFLLLLLPGVIPLVLSSFYLLKSNREALQVKEKELLTLSAQGFAQVLSDDLAERAAQLRQVGQGLIAAPGFSNLEQRLRQDWARSYLQRFISQDGRDLRAFRFVDQKGRGQGSDMGTFEPQVIEAMNGAFDEAVGTENTVYRFALIQEAAGLTPAVAMAVPVAIPDSDDQLILQALAPLAMRRAAGEGLDLEELFLIDAGGKRLWSAGERPRIEEALLASDLVQRFAALPLNVTSEIELEVDGKKQSTLAQVVPMRETGWGVVAHKTTQVAFQQVQVLVLRILLFSALAALMALVFSLFASRGFSLPIQRLAETTHQIAAGHFDRRVSTEGLSFEVAELAEDFNRMSDTVESYIERLQKAAEVNRQLFISSIRAFAAAIDAKDPYTRGHSERVARYSRAIARYLGLPKDMQEKVWISAVLHDVGKIGVEDRVLKKHGVLTPEEFEQMKLHPVIGADIVEPISALRDHLPGIRWHHEAWNGSGYPDGLKGEQIPLMARIIGVADTFDAITTNRPYQTASSPEFAIQTVKKLTGTRFDARIVTGFLLAWDAGQIEMDPPSAELAALPQVPSAEEAAATAAAPRKEAAAPTGPGSKPPSAGISPAPRPTTARGNEATLEPAPPETSAVPARSEIKPPAPVERPAASAPSGIERPASPERPSGVRKPIVPRIEPAFKTTPPERPSNVQEPAEPPLEATLEPLPPELFADEDTAVPDIEPTLEPLPADIFPEVGELKVPSIETALESLPADIFPDVREPRVPRIESRLEPVPSEEPQRPDAAKAPRPASRQARIAPDRTSNPPARRAANKLR